MGCDASSRERQDQCSNVVDGAANNCLFIASIKDGKILEKIEGLNNATVVTVDSRGAIYVGEVNGKNVKKLVRQ